MRAKEWCFHFLAGNVVQAVAIEQAGPPIRPSAVIAAAMVLLAEERLMLVPILADEPEATGNNFPVESVADEPETRQFGDVHQEKKSPTEGVR